MVFEKRKNEDAYLVTGNIKHIPIETSVSASNYDVVSIAGNLLIYTTPSFEALTKLHAITGWQQSGHTSGLLRMVIYLYSP